MELLTANYTFVNERLAQHYGIPNVYGAHFRRVTFEDGRRGGLLGHASTLTVTSYPNRTSPVLRGKWVLANLLGAPPPPPPADIPALKDPGEDGQPTRSANGWRNIERIPRAPRATSAWTRWGFHSRISTALVNGAASATALRSIPRRFFPMALSFRAERTADAAREPPGGVRSHPRGEDAELRDRPCHRSPTIFPPSERSPESRRPGIIAGRLSCPAIVGARRSPWELSRERSDARTRTRAGRRAGRAGR